MMASSNNEKQLEPATNNILQQKNIIRNDKKNNNQPNGKEGGWGKLDDSLLKSIIYAGCHARQYRYHAAAMSVSETPIISETVGVSETLTRA
jgi:hypothetical protein